VTYEAPTARHRGPLPVSVVIPAYNRADLIGRAISSALAQAPRPPAEVIVVDDASSDATADTAEAMGVRVLRHDTNQGEAGARNTGIAAANQPWVALLDSDDEWLPHHLDQLWALRGEHVLVADAMLACREDSRLDRLHGIVSKRPVVLAAPGVLVFPQNFVNPSATMFRREAGIDIGGYGSFSSGVDLHFLLRLLERGTGIVTPAVGGLYHVHEGQMTHDGRAFAAGLREVVASFAGRPWWSAELLEQLTVVHTWDDFRQARRERDDRRARSRGRWLLRRPERMRALLAMWLWRLRGRRRSGLTARDGRPTVAVLPGDRSGGTAAAVREAEAIGSVVDLGATGTLAGASAALVRRPTALGLCESPAQWVVLRLLGIRPVRRARPRPGH